MEINIRRSASMDQSWDLLEDNVIRIPEKVRTQFNLQTYKTISLKSKDKNLIDVCILPSYKEDEEHNPNVGYVSSSTYNKLQVEKPSLHPVNQLLIGCDPELFLVHKPSSRVVPAVDYFYNNPMNNTVGNDGVLLELRPPPNINSQTVVDTIGKLLQQARNKVNTDRRINKLFKNKDLSLVGSSYYETHSAGFHVHFGIPPEILNPKLFNVRQTVQQIVNILDYYIGVPAITPEPTQDANRRTDIKVRYGKPGDWRLEFPTLEYRVPGGFLLTHPTLTKGLMGLAWVVMDDILARIKTCTDDFSRLENVQSIHQASILYPHIFKNTSDVFEIMCSPTPQKALKHIDTIFTDIEDMLSFEKEKKSIVNLYNTIVSDKHKTHNIEENWGLSYELEEMEFRTASK